ncbi:MAG: universal stress protein [Candidatus Nitrosopolaris sp.]
MTQYFSTRQPDKRFTSRRTEEKVNCDCSILNECLTLKVILRKILRGQGSYKIQTGKPVEEIIKVSGEMDVDLLVMLSSKTSSFVRKILGSTVRRVIDSVENSVLVVHDQ